MSDPTGAIIAAIIAGVCAIVAAVIGTVISYFNRRKLQEIHVLVNSRLDEALAEIADLKEERDKGLK